MLNVTVGTVGGAPAGSVLVFLQDAAVNVRIRMIANGDTIIFFIRTSW